MKINSLSLISLATILTATSANAGAVADFYIGGMVGAGGETVFMDGKDSTDSSMVYGAVAGVDIPLFRFEGEYNHLNSDAISANTAMFNMYFKVPSTLILPYVGAGIGSVFSGDHTIKADGIKTTYDIKSTAAYQGMLGATIDLPALPVKFDVEGHVLYSPNIYENPVTFDTPDLLQYNVRAKLRVIF